MDNDLKKYREELYKIEGNRYPGKALVDMELRPGYIDAKENRILPMLALNEAQLVMLVECGIVSKEDAHTIVKALEGLDYRKYESHEYTGEYEDLFFEIEDDLIKLTNGLAGNIHIARSRNDMSLCMDHMVVRERLLSLIKLASEVRNTVRLFAKEHKETLFVAFTHAQHAQPSVFGHYFLGVFDVLGRDIKRFQEAYEKVNQSPMGAAAITTSGFPINRFRVAELLGFSSVIENSFDAIGNIDFNTDTASSILHASIDLGRVVTDMVTWATQDMDILRLADGYISTSSIMPQKRNPIALEHLRASLSIVKGLASSVLDGYFKSPYGDISDHEDIEPILLQAIDLLKLNYRLFNAVIATMEVNKDLLEKRAYESFSVVTEMADTVVRECKIPFRKAHQIVSKFVKKAEEAALTLKTVGPDLFSSVYKDVMREPFKADYAKIQQSLDPCHFVEIRNVYGGIAPSAMEEQLKHAESKVMDDESWIDNQRRKLKVADEKRMAAIALL